MILQAPVRLNRGQYITNPNNSLQGKSLKITTQFTFFDSTHVFFAIFFSTINGPLLLAMFIQPFFLRVTAISGIEDACGCQARRLHDHVPEGSRTGTLEIAKPQLLRSQVAAGKHPKGYNNFLVMDNKKWWWFQIQVTISGM